MTGDPAAAAAAAAPVSRQRRGPVCALCRAAATLYCRQDDAFLCEGCDVRVHNTPELMAQHQRLPTPQIWATAATAPSASDASGSASLGSGPAAEQLLTAAESTPAAAAAAAAAAVAAAASAPSAAQLASCFLGRTSSHLSPFSFTHPDGLQPPPPLPRDGAFQPATLAPPPVTTRATLDAELMECLEGLCTDPLAPLDFGYDLGRINATPELEAFDSCVECGTALASCSCAAIEGRAAGAAAAAAAAPDGGAAAAVGGALVSTLSTRSCSTVSRPGSNSQQSQMDAAAAAAAGVFGAAMAVAAAAAGADGAALWQRYRPTSDWQTVLVEERLRASSAAAAAAQRKRAAEGAPEGSLPPPAAPARAVEGGEGGPVPLSRRWTGSSGVGAVVTTGIAGRGSGLIPTMPSLTPATPTADTALAPTMGSLIWQHPAHGSLGPAGSSMVLSSGAAPSGSQRPSGAVTTGLAEAAAALQRHAVAAAAAVKAEPSMRLTIRMPAKSDTAATSPTPRSVPLALPAPPSAAALPAPPSAAAAAPATGVDKPAGSSGGSGGARAALRTPRAPARRTPRATSSAGGGSEGSRDMPPIPQFRKGETRADKLARYRAKRERRRFQKTVRYECRKHYADLRPRIKGRFVSPEEFAAYKASQQAEAAGGTACAAVAGEGSPTALMACAVAAC
ncbi:hypothetical protein ABPG75_004540 [Micractinium tetrahymenae]